MKCDLTNVSIKINGTCLERIGNDCNEKATNFFPLFLCGPYRPIYYILKSHCIHYITII